MKKLMVSLVAVLAIAVVTWLGVFLWQTFIPVKGDGPEIGASAELSDRTPTGSQAMKDAPSNLVSPDELTIPGELLVADPPQGFLAGAEQLGFKAVEIIQLRQLEMEIFRMAVPRGMKVSEARKKLASRFPGVSIDTHRAFETQGLAEYAKQTARPMAGWPRATESCGAGLRIGQIDSPVDIEHPALKGQRIEFRSFHKESRRPGPADHGTAVAAMLVGKANWGGLLPGAELIAANMFEVNETGKVIGSGMGLLRAIDWMAQKKVQVVNMSVAGGDNKVVRKAFRKARKKGLVLVAAAGNWGSATRAAYPAAYGDVIAVTALDKKREIYKKANSGAYIDFAAPGVGLYTAVPNGGRVMSGTSFATPFITVLLAMSIEAGAPSTPGALREMLAGRVLDLGNPGRDDVFGFGIVKLRPKCR